MEDGEGMHEMKTDITYTMGSKKLQGEFDDSVKQLTKRIKISVCNVKARPSMGIA